MTYDEPSVPNVESLVEYLPPRSAIDRSFRDGLTAGRLEAATILVGGYLLKTYLDYEHEGEGEGEGEVSFQDELKATRELISELTNELRSSPESARIAAIYKPVDGVYRGETAEDDGGDQGVMTELRFNVDGTIEGTGDDADDGPYVIREGSWSAKRVAWIEEYNKGFQVALRGQVRPDGTVLGLWAASTGVAGSVELRPPHPR